MLANTSPGNLKRSRKSVLVLIVSILFTMWAMVPTAVASTELYLEYRLPMHIANNAATVAIDRCKTKGAHISATVVDQHGIPIAKLKGDNAAPHTFNLSEQKAYTAISLAPIQGVSSTSEVAEKLTSTTRPMGSMALPSSPIEGIIAIPGALIIKTSTGITVGAIGASGAASGSQDEQCAQDGLDAIANNLEISQDQSG